MTSMDRIRSTTNRRALDIVRGRKTEELSIEIVDRDFRRFFNAELERVLPANDGIGRDVCPLTAGLI